MRIGIYAPNMTTGTPSGVERYVSELAGALARASSGHEFVLFSDASLEGMRRVALPPMGWWSRLRHDQGRFSPIANAEALDVLFCPKSAVPAGLACPAVATVHDVIFLRHPEFYPWGWRVYWTRTLRRSLERAAAVVCVSETTARDVEELVPEARGKARAVPSGVGAAFFAAENRRSGDPYYLYLGNITARKNLDVLLTAWEWTRGRAPLVVAGTPDAGSRGLVRRMRAAGIVPVPASDPAALYAGALALVYPSRYEGFGLPLLEAMAAGCPVIASTGGALPEVAGNAAVLADPDDTSAFAAAMERVATDAAFRAELVEKGRARAREFTWERTAAGTLEVLEKAARPAPPSSAKAPEGFARRKEETRSAGS